MGFWETFDLWWEILAILVILSIPLAIIGVTVVLKKSYYLPLALSQVSVLGVVLTFWLHDFFEISLKGEYGALIFTLGVAFYFSNDKIKGKEGEIFIYLFGTALIFIFGTFIRKDLHDIDSILFGNVILVEREQIYYTLILMIVVSLIYVVRGKIFNLVNFDPDFAISRGYSPYWNTVFQYMIFGTVISISSRAIGGYTTFGLTILPAMGGINLGKGVKSSTFIAIFLSLLSLFLGYYISFKYEFPPGGSIVGFAGVFYVFTLIISFFRR